MVIAQLEKTDTSRILGTQKDAPKTSKFNTQSALRIGLAARCLPMIDMRSFIEILLLSVGHPLSCENLEKLTLGKLCDGARCLLDDVEKADLRVALEYLHGKKNIHLIEQPVVATPDAKIPHSIRVAIASDFWDLADVGLSECQRFLIYQVNDSTACFLEERVIPKQRTLPGAIPLRFSMIADCQIVWATTVGARNIAHLIKIGVYPLTCPMGRGAKYLIKDLQQVLRAAPPWLAKYMH